MGNVNLILHNTYAKNAAFSPQLGSIQLVM